jgi:hypothetical protein
MIERRADDLKPEYIVRPLRWISVLAILMAALSTTFFGQGSQTVTREEARRMIQEGNAAWGNARVTLDKNTFEKIMAPTPDFYVQLSNGRRLNRQQFLSLIEAYPPGVKLVRFDASVLTVEPSNSDWVALILEKLEIERKSADGKTEKEYVVSITRDGWRKLSGDKWVALFSEQLGQERWKGSPPPIANW